MIVQGLQCRSVKILELPDLKKMMSYDKGKAGYHGGELSRAKLYLLNTGVPAKPSASPCVAMSANYRLIMRTNDANNGSVVASTGYRPDGAITSGNSYFDDWVRVGILIILNAARGGGGQTGLGDVKLWTMHGGNIRGRQQHLWHRNLMARLLLLSLGLEIV